MLMRTSNVAVWAAALLSASALVLTPTSASACTCSQNAGSGDVLWPEQDAKDVPFDTTLALWTFQDQASQVTPVLTRTDDGVEIPLNSLRSLGASGCGGETVLLRPARALEANTSYRVSFRFESSHPDAMPGHFGNRTFVTGDDSVATRAAPQIEVTYGHLMFATDCTLGGMPCDDYAETLIEATYADDVALPLWVTLRQDKRSNITQLSGNKAQAWGNSAGLSIEPGETCINIEIVDVYGRELANEERCKPNRCAELTKGSSLTDTSCGTDLPPIGTTLWSQVPDDDCASRSIFRIEREGITKVSENASSSGCALGSSLSMAGWPLLAMCGALVVRRKKWATRSPPP